ncbi:nitrilase-related carbon-nitrogen hydrolase [Candidatus Palauibacter sp.]|uniref:nitrilase-related carbon-nitrogen hydrolase n=1 Tax=Candidatus Palauibacter sp. TaxID=3101350 RepID=UPI003B58B655
MPLDIAIAQFRPVKGDFDATLDACARVVERALGQELRPRLLVFPETALTGYFLEGGVREQALPAPQLFERLNARTGPDAAGLDVAIGFYELDAGCIYNSAMYATLGPGGGIRHVHRKVFLPTYGVFQEERFVEAGPGIEAFDGPLGRTALLICEEGFHSISGTLAALGGAAIILILSASPARGAAPGAGMPGNLARWDALASGIAAEHGVFVIVSQLVGFEAGKGFAGGSAAYDPRGDRLVAGPLWEEALLPVQIDLGEIARARTDEPLFADLERSWTRLLVNSPGSGVRRPAAELE